MAPATGKPVIIAFAPRQGRGTVVRSELFRRIPSRPAPLPGREELVARTRWFHPKASTQVSKPFVCKNDFSALNVVSPLNSTRVKRCVDALGRHHRKARQYCLCAPAGARDRNAILNFFVEFTHIQRPCRGAKNWSPGPGGWRHRLISIALPGRKAAIANRESFG